MTLENFNEEYMTRDEVAAIKIFGSTATVDRRAKEGKITRVKFGKRTFFKRRDVEEYLKSISLK